MKRTTHRSTKGTKLYALRNSRGQFQKIQSYKRAYQEAMKKKAAGEQR